MDAARFRSPIKTMVVSSKQRARRAGLEAFKVHSNRFADFFFERRTTFPLAVSSKMRRGSNRTQKRHGYAFGVPTIPLAANES